MKMDGWGGRDGVSERDREREEEEGVGVGGKPRRHFKREVKCPGD